MPFQKGHDLNRAGGGKRKGSGRKPDEFKAKAAKIGDPLKILQYYWNVSQGFESDFAITHDGTIIKTPVATKDRIKASELFLDRTIGKVPQPISGEEGGPITVKVVNYA